MYQEPYGYSNCTDGSCTEPRKHIVETLLAGIKREAAAADLYSRLAEAAPNQKHRNELLQASGNKKVYLKTFANLYFSLTGAQPVYQIQQVPFQGYRDGLQKAYEAELDGYQEYHKNCVLIQHPYVRTAFLQALSGEQAVASRVGFLRQETSMGRTDYGLNPFVVNIEEATIRNSNFRTALWTGEHFQITLMSIGVGEDIGLEIHPDLDQFLRIEQGQGLVQMGDRKDQLDFQQRVADDFAVVIPAGKWHNLINTGSVPLKLYSIYAPPQHPFGTVHHTKAEAMAAEENHH